MRLPWKTKGSEIQSELVLLEEKYGPGTIDKIERKLSDLGYPLDCHQIRTAAWYKDSFHPLVLLVAKSLFGLTDEEIFEIGYKSPKISLGAKIYIKYFSSPRQTLKLCSADWKKFADHGEMEAGEFNEKEKYCTLRLKDYKFHPVMCSWIAGFLLGVAENTFRSEKITIEETACMFKDSPYHEFRIRWE